MKPLSQADFRSALDISKRQFHTQTYLDSSFYRQYKSACMVLRCLPNNSRILSLGAGGAFVEEFAAKRLDASVFVADFAETLSLEEALYSDNFDGAFPSDLSSPTWCPPVGDLDAVFWFDNIEHLQIDPTAVLKKLCAALAPQGQLFLTTDNFARLRNIIKLSANRSIIPLPGDLFSRMDFEHEHVHRREYTLPEIKTCLREAGLRFVEAEFLWQNQSENFSKSIFRGIEYLLPRLRPHMLIRALKTRK
jgi:SAM-dependent methyltransferase